MDRAPGTSVRRLPDHSRPAVAGGGAGEASAAARAWGAMLVAARTWLARPVRSLRGRCASVRVRRVLLHAASATVRVRCALLDESLATVGLRRGSLILETAALARRNERLRPARNVLRGGQKRLQKPAVLIPRCMSRHSRSNAAHSHSLRIASRSSAHRTRTVASDSRSNTHRRATVALRGNGNTFAARDRQHPRHRTALPAFTSSSAASTATRSPPRAAWRDWPRRRDARRGGA